MKQRKVYVCTECDYQSPSWLGRCPSCGAWNSFEEETYKTAAPKAAGISGGTGYKYERSSGRAEPFSEADDAPVGRMSTGIGEMDRVLGGGLVEGSAVLLAGEPGIGKSTILLQLCGTLESGRKILYVSGEESRGQLKMRADRLSVSSDRLSVLTDTELETIIREKERVAPDVVIIDSIQTVTSSAGSTAGSVAQVKECAAALISCAKDSGTSVIIVGHVNKEGSIAGPKVLEHMVDAVLYFEGERSQSHRIIRAAKNRFGSTNEIGVFEMGECGLEEVENPSAMFFSGRPENVPGSCAVCVMEGSRPIIAEVQALVIPTQSQSPRRTADGIDYNRMYLLLAVLEKRLGLRFSSCDVYLNVVGGLRLEETAADAAIATALLSSIRDLPVPEGVITAGEIGLAGEVRAIASSDKRISEAKRLGFNRIAIPAGSKKNSIMPASNGIAVTYLRSVFDILKLFKTGDDTGK